MGEFPNGDCPSGVLWWEKEVDGAVNICYVLKDSAEMFLFRGTVL